ncbi:transposase [Deinococcus misasensis]|uniref:transposase n=1 Tax=Deinococcus misasensis TaxID=392413 RepID=UPI00055373DC|nr:transposase [Deinococcus misasensis]
MRKTPTKYTADFKLHAVQLALQPGVTQTRVAQDLGIPNQILGRWIKKHKEAQEQGRPVFTGRGVPALTEQEKRIKELEKEVEILRIEREILKRAAKFFAAEME